MQFDDTLRHVATELIRLCRPEDVEEAFRTLYDQNVVSVEAAQYEAETPRVINGLDAVRAKHAWFHENFDLLESSWKGPFLHGDHQFAIIFDHEVRHRSSGEHDKSSEIGIYTVENGKIVREEFYYDMGM